MKLFSMLTKIRRNKKAQTGNRDVGSIGEDIAARFLARKGYRIVQRNVKTFIGEIDIVARKKELFVFAEVKARKSPSFVPPYFSVTRKKRKKLLQCALCYLNMKNIENSPWRIDVISVELGETKTAAKKIEHFENALE